MTILIPALGKQGGDFEKSVKFGMNSKREGFIPNWSRSILYASDGDDFAQAAREEASKMHNSVIKYRKG